MTQTTPPLSEYDLLIRLRDFARARFFVALIMALVAAVIGGALAITAYDDMDCIPLYAGFAEWDPEYGPVIARCAPGESPCRCEIAPPEAGFDTLDIPRGGPAAKAADETLGDHFRVRRESFMRYLDDFVQVDDAHDIAGLARFAAVIVTGLISIAVYRGLADEAYEANLKRAQLNEILEMKRTLAHMVASVVIVFPACLIAYLTLSAIWLLMADMFEALTLTPGGAILFTALFVGLVGFVVSHLMSVLTTRQLVIMGMLVFVVGMAAAFAMGGQVERPTGLKHWWQTALSTLGEEPGTDILFLYVFAALFIVFWIVWFDIADFLRDALSSDEKTPKWGVFNGPARLLRRIFGDRATFFNGLRFFYFLAAGSLLSVGIFPLVNAGSHPVYFLTLTLHSGASVLAMLIYWIGGMIVVTHRLKGIVFGWRFVALSYVTFFGIIAAGILIAVRIANLTAVEITVFALIGIWLYAAIDNLLEYSDLKALETDAHTAQGSHTPHPMAERINARRQGVFSQPILRRGAEPALPENKE